MRAVLVMLALLACGVPAPAPSVGVLPGAAPWSAPDRAAVTEALQSMPQDRPLRTRHLDDSGRPVYTNRLLLESSPYLRQHAHNPVDWMPWGEEAFERARRENKPVLLSVGYSTCHWCHVMEEESFEDLAIAERLNRDFVAVKVDREERPDVDAVYMRAVQSLAGRGGWPMTVVMTPDGQPFFAGTYFPARSGDRGARQGFEELLVELTGRWTGDRDNLMAHAAEVSRRMEMLAKSPVPSEVPGEDAFTQATERLVASHDAARGGFGKAPKFPQPSVLRFLLAEHTRSGDPAPRDAALRTLDAILTGGIRDHVGGGFHRYSVDADWEVPHFEKMLYDQAQLVQALLDAFQLTGDERYADAARDTLDYVLREQRDPAGGFRCATDADSLSPEGERVEGWYFTWTPAELDAVLGERSRIARAWYGVTTEGNLEGRSVLSARRTVGDVAEELGVEPAALRAELDEIRKLLFRARAERPPPFQDDKVVLAWNAQMVSAFARASFVLDQPAYLEVARRAAKFANRYMTDDQGRFLRSWRDQRTSDLAVAEDYAFHALAMIDLFEASGSPDDLFLAESAVRQLDRRFGDLEVGGWYETAHDAEKLLTRGKPWSDGAQPSANGAALLAVARLHAITADDHYRERLDQGLALFGSDLARRGGASPTMLRALGFRLGRPQQVVIVPGDGVAQLHQVLRTSHDPTRIQVLVPPSLQLGGRVALVDGKVAKDGLATAYVCYAGVCEQPTTDAEQLRQQLAQTTKGMSDLRSGG